MDKDSLIREIMYHDENNIKGFFEDYRWLSNMTLVDIKYKGILYPSTENAYQASKFDDEDVRLHISSLTPTESKKYANKNKKKWVKYWDNIKLSVMFEISTLKYQHYELREALDETDDKYLEETNYWKDTYWGVFENVGSNNLGKILMDIRSINRNETPKYNVHNSSSGYGINLDDFGFIDMDDDKQNKNSDSDFDFDFDITF